MRDFSAQLGELEINVASQAGQDWHTDMSYSRQIAFANVLYGIKIPRRDGRALGGIGVLANRVVREQG